MEAFLCLKAVHFTETYYYALIINDIIQPLLLCCLMPILQYSIVLQNNGLIIL